MDRIHFYDAKETLAKSGEAQIKCPESVARCYPRAIFGVWVLALAGIITSSLIEEDLKPQSS